jgi:hypothetical protein
MITQAGRMASTRRRWVPELWVVELNERVTYVFRGPGSAAWANAAQVSFDDPIAALCLPGAQVRWRSLRADVGRPLYRAIKNNPRILQPSWLGP